MSPAESLSTLPAVPLAYFDQDGHTGVVTFSASPLSATFTFTLEPNNPLVYNLTQTGDTFTGSNITSGAVVSFVVSTTTSCVGFFVPINDPAAKVYFGARMCPMPASALPFEGSGTNPYMGNIAFTPTQITVTDSSGGNYSFAVISMTVGAQIVFAAEMISGASTVVLRGVLYSPTTGIFAIEPTTNENPPGGSYVIGAGGYLPLPSMEFFVGGSTVSSGSIVVDANSHLWFTGNNGNVYGPLFVAINFLGGYNIGNVGFGGSLPVGGNTFSQMTGFLNATLGEGTLLGAPTLKDTNTSWKAGGTGLEGGQGHRHHRERK